MSASAASEPLPQGAPALRPAWLRPAALALILAAHAAVLLVVKADPDAAPQLDSLEVALVPLGDASEDQKPQEEIKPADEPPPPPPPAAPAQASEMTAPPPETIAPEAPPLPVAKPKPKPVVEEPSPAELRRLERQQREAEERRREAQEERETARREREIEHRKAQEARQEAHRGAAHGAARANGMSQAAYAGLVISELNRRKFFPAAARAAGVTGAVGVAFTIGPSGRVVSQSVTRSSGNASLDGAARAIMSSIHAPPPPGGRFSTATSIRFNLN